MKLLSTTAAVLLLAAPLSASARSLDFFDFNQQSPISTADKAFPVAGDNPLTYCSDPSNNILQIDSVDLSPNPPQPGQTLTIVAKGTFREKVDEGSKVLLQVKYGLIRLINQEADLCEQIENVDLHCPLEKGKMTFTKDVELPKEIPPGKYSVLADVYTEDKRKITCLEANDIVFNR
ncbi:ML domain protein [Paecilomyces variotii No. 5]|uniref:Phosphatidylglycerol/phosphatidylinositol transfer protein n=1 Tax=Byssochlamys spectabilis (strain No. 5 / NBRC 109023) TaxID=1356009 RepID=V5FZ22_BYSSN|nr:ML domain protein [Paecilomyces variotii No. 5]